MRIMKLCQGRVLTQNAHVFGRTGQGRLLIFMRQFDFVKLPPVMEYGAASSVASGTWGTWGGRDARNII